MNYFTENGNLYLVYNFDDYAPFYYDADLSYYFDSLTESEKQKLAKDLYENHKEYYIEGLDPNNDEDKELLDSYEEMSDLSVIESILDDIDISWLFDLRGDSIENFYYDKAYESYLYDED